MKCVSYARGLTVGVHESGSNPATTCPFGNRREPRSRRRQNALTIATAYEIVA